MLRYKHTHCTSDNGEKEKEGAVNEKQKRTQLAVPSATPNIQPALVTERSRVRRARRDLHDVLIAQEGDLLRLQHGEAVANAALAMLIGAPPVNGTIVGERERMAKAARDRRHGYACQSGQRGREIAILYVAKSQLAEIVPAGSKHFTTALSEEQREVDSGAHLAQLDASQLRHTPESGLWHCISKAETTACCFA